MPIFKYVIPTTDEFQIRMSKGATVLTVDVQNGLPCIWALVDKNAEQEYRSFRLLGTGFPSDDVSGDQYVGTVLLHGGALVLHLFDVRKPD